MVPRGAHAQAGQPANASGADMASRSPRATSFLKQGINLSHWLWLPQQQEAAKRWNFVTRDELRMLAQRGLTHVRLPLDPAILWDQTSMSLHAGAWGEAVHAAQLCLDSGLGVIIDLHPLGGRSQWIMPDKESGATPHLDALWKQLGPLCKVWDPAQVALEIMNEPHDIAKPEQWHAAQRRVHAIIRESCPDHTIIATGDQWGGIDGLLALDPLTDPNVVYSFHFYEPMTFTHQGATWGWDGWKDLKNVPYPITIDEAKQYSKSIENQRSGGAVVGEASNGEEARRHNGWNIARMRERIAKASAWAQRHDQDNQPLSLYCGEFGVHKPFSPADSRAHWLRDITSVLGELRIGWAMWDYVGGFALTREGSREVDQAICNSIGLK